MVKYRSKEQIVTEKKIKYITDKVLSHLGKEEIVRVQNKGLVNYLTKAIDKFVDEDIYKLFSNITYVKRNEEVEYGVLHLTSNLSEYRTKREELLELCLTMLNDLEKHLNNEGISYVADKHIRLTNHNGNIVNRALAYTFMEYIGLVKFHAYRVIQLEDGKGVPSKWNRCLTVKFNYDKYVSLLSDENELVVDKLATKTYRKLDTATGTQLYSDCYKSILKGFFEMRPATSDYIEAKKYFNKLRKDYKANYDDKHVTYRIIVDLYEGNLAALLRISEDLYAGRIHTNLTMTARKERHRFVYRDTEEDAVEVDVTAMQPVLLLNLYDQYLRDNGYEVENLFWSRIEELNTDFYKLIGAYVYNVLPEKITPYQRDELKKRVLHYLYSGRKLKSFAFSEKEQDQIAYRVGYAINRVDSLLSHWIESKFKGRSNLNSQFKSYLPQLMQKKEVEVFSKIWRALIKENITFSTVHDAIKCRKSDAEKVREIMQKIFNDNDIRLFNKGIKIE